MENENEIETRGIRSRMPELTRPKAYLTYDVNEITHDLLLTEQKRVGVTVHVNGKTYVFARRLPVRIMNDLRERFGAYDEPNEFSRFRGTERLFDTPGTQTRAYTLKGERKIQIRIVGDSANEVFRKMSHIKGVMGDHGVRETECTWDRIGHITMSDRDPRKKKMKPEFDAATMHTLKQKDLAAYRDDYKDPMAAD